MDITFALEGYLTLHGFPQRSMELLMELELTKLNEIAKNNNDISNEAASLHQIGMDYQGKGDYEAALTQYQKALEIFEKIGDIADMANSMGQMGENWTVPFRPKSHHRLPFTLISCIITTLLFLTFPN